MSRPTRGERLASSKCRPRRRAAKTHFFKYQLANNPTRAEENDLKRALQESLEEQKCTSNGKTIIGNNKNTSNNRVIINSSTNSSDVSKASNNSSSTSNESCGSSINNSKRTRSSTPASNATPPSSKRARLIDEHKQNNNINNSNNTNKNKCDSDQSVLSGSPTALPQINKAIRTYSRSQPNLNGQQQKQSHETGPKSSTPLSKKPPTFGADSNGKEATATSKSDQSYVSRSTQTSASKISLSNTQQTNKQSDGVDLRSKSPQNNVKNIPKSLETHPQTPPVQEQYLKFKRESKNYAYVKMTALKVSTSKSPSSHSKPNPRKSPNGSWSLLGVPEEKVIYLRDDEPPRRLICYPAIKHVEGDVIQVKDSVLLRSGAKKTDLPYIAKVCAFWEDAETGVMMSLFWYYRPEHTEEGRKPHHLPDEIFASRHRDVDSVECIEDKCYVLTFNEYCRYRKRCKMEQVNTTWSLADVTIPVSNESYPRRNRIPDIDVNPELVFCCRQIYDSRMKRLVKNPLINPKYGHI